MKSIFRMSSTVAIVALCSGCGGAGEVEGDEEFGVMEEAIGEAGCATATPDVTVSGNPDVESPLTYSHSSCFKAYVVRVNNFSSRKDFTVRWASAAPTDQATCENAYARGDLYRLSGSTWSLVDQQSASGTWLVGGFPIGSLCIPPGVTLQPPSTTGTYKVAMTARKTPSSSAATRRVRLGLSL